MKSNDLTKNRFFYLRSFNTFPRLFLSSEKPQPPRNIKVTNVQTRYFAVTWEKPKDGDYYQVQNYTIEIKAELAKNFTIVEILPYSRAGLMIKDLEPATEYTIRVSSSNKYGISDGILVTQSTLQSKRQIDCVLVL